MNQKEQTELGYGRTWRRGMNLPQIEEIIENCCKDRNIGYYWKARFMLEEKFSEKAIDLMIQIPPELINKTVESIKRCCNESTGD